MKVIALKGAENTGKSHTINIAYQFLLKDGYSNVKGHFRVLGNPVYEDVLDILFKGDFKVGICGMGDYQRGDDSLAKLLKYLEANGCDVCICSCQSKPGIEKAATAFSSHIFIEKTFLFHMFRRACRT